MRALISSTLLLLLLSAMASAPPAAAALSFQLPFHNPWDAFKNLTDCHAGDRNPALVLLKSYLAQFGYLPNSTDISDAFDDALEAALRAYQHNLGLNATGSLDLTTLDQLMAPRCGVADVINGTSSAAARGRNLFAYFPGKPTWPRSRRALTYAFTSTSAVSIDGAALRAVFARAFARWSDATTLTFREAESAEEADITIGFFGGDHGDGEPFDGVLGTLAHAFSPADGRFHLDAAEKWVAEGDVTAASSDVAVDLESVAVHEIGHLLVMGHSSVAESIMYPTIRTRTRKVELTGDDVAGIQGLYGGNPNYTGSSFSSPTTAPPSQERETNGGAGRLVGPGLGRRIGGVLAVVVVGLLVL